jgi:hypothetical protein
MLPQDAASRAKKIDAVEDFFPSARRTRVAGAISPIVEVDSAVAILRLRYGGDVISRAEFRRSLHQTRRGRPPDRPAKPRDPAAAGFHPAARQERNP